VVDASPWWLYPLERAPAAIVTGAVQKGYGEEINLVPPPGFEHHTVQLVGSRETDNAILFLRKIDQGHAKFTIHIIVP
jgi:hypothetical protein